MQILHLKVCEVEESWTNWGKLRKVLLLNLVIMVNLVNLVILVNQKACMFIYISWVQISRVCNHHKSSLNCIKIGFCFCEKYSLSYCHHISRVRKRTTRDMSLLSQIINHHKKLYTTSYWENTPNNNLSPLHIMKHWIYYKRSNTRTLLQNIGGFDIDNNIIMTD